MGRTPWHRPGTRAWTGVPAADGRGHRPRAGQSAGTGGGGAGRRLRRRVADGQVAGGERLGAARRAGFRVLLRAALSLPPDRQEGDADGGCRGRVRAAAYGGGRAGPDPGRHPPRRHRRRGTRTGRQGRRGPHLAGARRAGGQRAALPAAARPVADGLAQRVRATAPQPAAAARHGARPRPGVSAAPVRPAGRAHHRDDAGGGVRRLRVAGDGGDVRPDAALLRAAAVARSSAAVHRVPVPPHDGRLGGAALPGRGAAWKGRTYARPETAADES